MEKNMMYAKVCLICKVKNKEGFAFDCGHEYCKNCFYILILYNRNSLELFMSNMFEEEIEINCICHNGLFKLNYCANTNQFKIHDSKGKIIEDLNINISSKHQNIENKMPIGAESIEHTEKLIFSDDKEQSENYNLIKNKNKNNKSDEAKYCPESLDKINKHIQKDNNSNLYENLIHKICEGCEETYSSYYCYDCASFSCNDCFKKIHSLYRKFFNHRKTEKLNELFTDFVICKIHNKKFIYNCLTCNKFICLDCINCEEENKHDGHTQEYISDFFPTKINENILALDRLEIARKINDNNLKQKFYLDKTEEKMNEINYFFQNQINLLEKLRISMIDSLGYFKKTIIKNFLMMSYIFESLNRDITLRELDKLNFITTLLENVEGEKENFSNDILGFLMKNIENNTILNNLPTLEKFKIEFEQYSNNLYYNFMKNSISHQKIEKNDFKIIQYSLLNYMFSIDDKIYFIFPNNLDSIIYIIDVETKKEILSLKYHEENVNFFKIFFLNNKNYLISASDDGIIVIWNLEQYFKEYFLNTNKRFSNKPELEAEDSISNEKRKFMIIDTEIDNLLCFTILSYHDQLNKQKNFEHLICSYNTAEIKVYDIYNPGNPIKSFNYENDIIIVYNYLDTTQENFYLFGESDYFIELFRYEIDMSKNKRNINIVPFKKFKKDGENKYFSNFSIFKIPSSEFIIFNEGTKIKFINTTNFNLSDIYIDSEFPISSFICLDNDLLLYSSNSINFIKIDFLKLLECVRLEDHLLKINYSNNEIFKLINKLENNENEIHSLSATHLKKDNLQFNYISIITGDSTIKIFSL